MWCIIIGLAIAALAVFIISSNIKGGKTSCSSCSSCPSCAHCKNAMLKEQAEKTK